MGINTSKECLEEALDKISQSMISSQTKVIVGYLRERDRVLKNVISGLESGIDELCEALDRQTQRLIERDQKLNKAIALLADVVASRDLERESYNLHNKIEEFINEN